MTIHPIFAAIFEAHFPQTPSGSVTPVARQGGGGLGPVVSRPDPETLRASASPGGVAPQPGAQPATASPCLPHEAVAGTGGSMRDHDDLCVALDAYEGAVRGFDGVERLSLLCAASECGWPGEDLLGWSRLRAATYRKLMGAAASELAAVISTMPTPDLEGVLAAQGRVG